MIDNEIALARPIRYCFFMTGNSSWLDLAQIMHESGVATPVLWLGDDRHYSKAHKLFGDSVVPMLSFVHRPFDIPNVDYKGEFAHFFTSEDYLDAKDICLKMMDRLDLNGAFSRIDREAYFHKLTVWALKFFFEVKPDAILMIEKPHSHAQYIIYRIAKYLGIPAAHFKDCSLFPVNFLQTSDGSFIEKKWTTNRELSDRFDQKIEQYVSKVAALKDTQGIFSPSYMVSQQRNSQFLIKASNFIYKGWRPVCRDFFSDIKLYTDKGYRAINPYRSSFIARVMIKYRRKANLKSACDRASKDQLSVNQFVYFPLHYEPERTTNPDGENFHDQFKALVVLREWLPLDIDIVVKEHPSQFLMADRGSRGRSPYFYDLIKNVKGVRLVKTDESSMKLIRKCSMVATITGSVAVEAALMGKKSIVFGLPWFAGCPNAFLWKDLDNFDEMKQAQVVEPTGVEEFLKKLVKNYGVPMVNNAGQLKAYRQEWYSSEFEEVQLKEMIDLITLFFKDKCQTNPLLDCVEEK